MRQIALVVVDMQPFFLKKLSTQHYRILVESQVQLIKKFFKNKSHIFFLEFNAGGKVRGRTDQRLLSAAHGLGETIVKDSNSGFTDTDLDTKLRKSNVKELVIVGVNANGCVQDTVIGAKRRGYKVTTLGGLMASTSRGDLTLSKQNLNWYKDNTKYIEGGDRFVL